MISKAPVGFYPLRGLWCLLPLTRSPESCISGALPTWVLKCVGLISVISICRVVWAKLKKKKFSGLILRHVTRESGWCLLLQTVDCELCLLPFTAWHWLLVQWVLLNWTWLGDNKGQRGDNIIIYLTAATFAEYPLGNYVLHVSGSQALFCTGSSRALQKVGDGAWKLAFITVSQVMLIWLIRDYIWRTTVFHSILSLARQIFYKWRPSSAQTLMVPK